jgi:hypothetical protein
VVFSVSIFLVWFTVPILGLNAIICIIKNWAAINSYAEIEEEKQINKIAGNLLIASFLFALILTFPKAFIHIFGNGTVLRFLWAIVIVLTGSVMGCISYKLYGKKSDLLKRIASVFSVILCLAVTVFILFSSKYFDYLIQCYDYSKKIETFSGSSKSLNQTIIIPTLDSPFTENKNIIWCSSFQLAWNKAKDDDIGEPLEVIEAEEIAARLNSAKQIDEDIESRSFYAAAGRIKQGIIEKINKEMAEKFPSHSVPDFNDIVNIPDAILAYSYLIANVPFKLPYRQVPDKFIFTDSNGVETNVGAFGVWGYYRKYQEIREQAELLFVLVDREETNYNRRIKEFAIDLCRFSEPYQVVVAIVEPKKTLEETLVYVRDQIADSGENPKQGYANQPLSKLDVIKVPEMFWEIKHDFDELLWKTVANADPAMSIVEARQFIKFRLDRCGAMLESESTLKVEAAPRYFVFNRPFLVYMKKRDREQPFFVMWVDNAELLNVK